MNDLIRREDANEALRECVRAYPNSFYNGIEVARTAIRKLPAVDAVEVVRHSEWHRTFDGYVCLKCGVIEDFARKYCPNCGAKMDGEDGDT